jgi:hypothetical protein
MRDAVAFGFSVFLRISHREILLCRKAGAKEALLSIPT